MKCIGAENPPCVRCAKSGRACHLSTSRPRMGHSEHPVYGHNSSHYPQPLAPPPLRLSGYSSGYIEEQHILQQFADRDRRPSLHRRNTNPVHSRRQDAQAPSSLDQCSSASSAVIEAPKLPGSESDTASPTKSASNLNSNGSYENDTAIVSEAEISHLGRFFVTNLLRHIPIMTEREAAEANTTTPSGERLAHCMAYVAAAFVPGCKAIRVSLRAYVSSVARLQSSDFKSTEQEQWTSFQCLAILYNWAPWQYSEHRRTDSEDHTPVELRREMLWATLRDFAVRHSLHGSATYIAEQRNGSHHIRHSLAHRKCLLWLWMYTEAHFQSLILQSPPHIREDRAIVRAIEVLNDQTADDYTRQVLAKAELCLLWSHPALRNQCLGQWWCSPWTPMRLESLLSVLDQMDSAMEEWRQKWYVPKQVPFSHEPIPASTDETVDCYYLYTRLLIASYVASAIKFSTIAEALPSSRIHLLTKTCERGSTLCRWLLEISPLVKYSLCFASEIIYAMVTSCCESLLGVLGFPENTDPNSLVQLEDIRKVARLLPDLNIRGSSEIGILSQRITIATSTIGSIRKTIPLKRPTTQHRRSMTWTAGGQELNSGQTSLSFAHLARPQPAEFAPARQRLDQSRLVLGQQTDVTAVGTEGMSMWNPHSVCEDVNSATLQWAT